MGGYISVLKSSLLNVWGAYYHQIFRFITVVNFLRIYEFPVRIFITCLSEILIWASCLSYHICWHTGWGCWRYSPLSAHILFVQIHLLLRVVDTRDSFKPFYVLYQIFATLVQHIGIHTRNLLFSEILHLVQFWRQQILLKSNIRSYHY